jgi:2-polyprenyl-6-methoxyphenol hydroxylase-like FAD-dependent oxidoreductase
MMCVAAQAPRLTDRKILLLEGSPQQSRELKPRYSNRVSSLNTGTKALLRSIGAWKHIANARYKAVKKLQVVQKCMHVNYIIQSLCNVAVTLCMSQYIFTKFNVESTLLTLRFFTIYPLPFILGFSPH